MSMLHSGSPFPSGVTPIPSPAVQPNFVPPAILVVNFFTKYKDAPKLTILDPSAPPVLLAEEHWVTWVKKGEQQGSSCTEAVKRLMPRPELDRPARIEWYVIGPAYEAWLKNEEAPINGQPLFAWSGISRELATELKKWNIFSVEDLADFPDHKINLVPIPGLRELRRRAKVTVDARELNSVSGELSLRDERILQLEAENRKNDARLAAMQATIEALSNTAGLAASQLTKGIPSPDDEFVQPGPNDSLVGARSVRAGGFQRRAPEDHIDRALGDVEGVYVAEDDEDAA